ncbi:hypothetical protein D3C81_1872370 [compost metagenome]
MNVAGDRAVLVVVQALSQQFGACGDGEQRIAQIMAEHCDELFAHFSHRPFLAQGALGVLDALLTLDLDGQQAGE